MERLLHAPRVQLFLPTVSAECLSYLERLRHLLTRPDVEVKNLIAPSSSVMA